MSWSFFNRTIINFPPSSHWNVQPQNGQNYEKKRHEHDEFLTLWALVLSYFKTYRRTYSEKWRFPLSKEPSTTPFRTTSWGLQARLLDSLALKLRGTLAGALRIHEDEFILGFERFYVLYLPVRVQTESARTLHFLSFFVARNPPTATVCFSYTLRYNIICVRSWW